MGTGLLRMLVYHIGVIYIIWRYLHCFFDTVRVKRRGVTAAYGIYLTAACIFDGLQPARLTRFLIDTALLYLLAQMYHGKQGKKLLAAALIQGMNLFCETLAVYLLYDGVVDGRYGAEMYYAVFLFMFLAERMMEKFCIRNIKESTVLRHWDLLIFLPAISVVMVFVMIVFDLHNRYIGSAVSASIICLNLIVFYICDELMGAYVKLKESALVARQLEGYSNQLNVVMRSEERVRGLRHDLKHHLYEIQMMADREKTEEIKDYVRHMQEDLQGDGAYISSGNQDIDSLVNLLLERARRELGTVRCHVCVPQKLDIAAFDWNIILGNLMDNAIEAAKNSADKYLQVTIRYGKGMLYIAIKNTFSGELVKAGDHYLSTKVCAGTEDAPLHGLGLRNVRRIVDKYDGSMELGDKEGIFTVRILMYVTVSDGQENV